MLENPTKPTAAPHRPDGRRRLPGGLNERAAEALMRPLGVVVLNELGDRVSQAGGREQLLKVADLAALQAVFDSCELDARGGYAKQTALAFTDCPESLMRWLVSQGWRVRKIAAT